VIQFSLAKVTGVSVGWLRASEAERPAECKIGERERERERKREREKERERKVEFV
jgi:hypothetical protein